MSSNLLVKAASTGRSIARVTPQSAGWRYVGFEALRLGAGERYEGQTADTELCIVVIAGRVDIDMLTEPLGTGSDGKPVFLADIWPEPAEIRAVIGESIDPELFRRTYEVVFEGDERWRALPIPDGGEERTNYLRALNNECIQAHAAKAYDAAVRIADRAQPVAQENPYIYHSAACAYAAVGDLGRAFEQVKLAMQHGYEHLSKIEVDADLGQLLEWPELKALFRDWRARQEGN